MIEQTFGPRRCRDTRKPLAAQCPDTAFYRCPVCGSVFCVTGAAAKDGGPQLPAAADPWSVLSLPLRRRRPYHLPDRRGL